ncbi:hypothetical protein VTO42DRAFT_3342 [Malbranchea cinnamomea]
MGIPLVWEPPAGRSGAHSKTESAAERRHRSTIRRSTYGRQSRTGFRPNITTIRYSPPASPLSREESPRERDSTLALGDFAEWPPLSSTNSNLSRRELGRRLLRESLRYSSPGRRLRLRRDPSLRLEMGSPLWSGGDWPQQSIGPASGRPYHRISFTRHFAPAYPMRIDSPTFAISTPQDNRANDDQVDANMPLLRRVGHRSVAEATDRGSHFDSLIDGLGDRERSFGPEDDAFADDDDDDEMHDAWETLLTTIRPDEQLPSSSSSFASATATASNSLSRNSGSTSSMNSTLTAPSSFNSNISGMPVLPDPFPEFNTNCDYTSSSDDSDTEAESEPESGSQRASNNSSHNRDRDMGGTNESGVRDNSSQEGRHQNQSRETETNRSTTTSLLESFGPEIQQVHAIIDTLSRRDDIPDEWWETAGLSRIIRRELNNTRSEGGAA